MGFYYGPSSPPPGDKPGGFRETVAIIWALFQRSVTLKERLLGPQHPDLASSLNNYAAFLRKTQNEREAVAWEARARAISGVRASTN